MRPKLVEKDDFHVLNHAARCLARDSVDPRHDLGQYDPGDPRARVAEAWRFPIVDAYSDGADPVSSYAFNEVTFVYDRFDAPNPERVAVVGTFSDLHDPIPLRRIARTDFFTLTVVVPKRQCHTYRYIADGRAEIDPINPQRVRLENGVEWSRFFTDLCTQLLSFERWERDLLDRLTDHVLPFRTTEGRRFLDRYYDDLDRQAKETQYLRAYELDESVGVANYIDKIVAREEAHRLVDYKLCLEQIDRVLRQRNPYVEPTRMSRQMYAELYEQMARNDVPGWDYAAYAEPRFFLQLLRRHTFTGAFSHPRYGGNTGAVGWAWLEQQYRDESGATLFDWRKSIERPLGESREYRG